MDQGPVATYLEEINETPLLSASEERALAARVASGDAQARDHMIRANLRLVVSIAKRYVHRAVPIEDLVQFGNLGVIHALGKFDPNRGIKFSTYATYWVKQYIRAGINNTSRVVRLPQYTLEILIKWNRKKNELFAKLNRPPTIAEVAETLHLSQRRTKIVESALKMALPYNSPPVFEHNGMNWEENIPDTRSPLPGSGAEYAEEFAPLLREVESLPERQREVVRMRFGLDGKPACTLQQIGDVLHLTRERVRQIEKEAMAKLRQRMGVLS